MIGHFASGVCMTAAPIYQENGVIEISPSSSHPDYSSIGDYIFRNNTVISKEGGASVDIAVNDLGKKNIGIISIMTDWGTNTSKIITDIIDGMSDKGVKVVAHEEVMEGSDDYSAAIAKLNEAGAEAVICCGMYNLVAPVAKQYKQVNPDVAIIAFSNAYSQQLLELGGGGLCLRLLGGLLGLFGLLLHLHGVDVFRRGLHRQLPRQQEIAGVPIGHVDHLSLLALALHVLL